MKTAIICFSLTGWQTGERLRRGLAENGNCVTLEGKSRYLPDSIPVSTEEWAGERFADSEQIIFIGACGIAVRSIAPYVRSKKTDPAVLVIDECGKYVISLLSGHLGGANALAKRAAEILGAVPVISTATDLHDRFAVDLFAKKNRCAIRNLTAAKEVSAALLAGKTVGFYSEFPCEGELPEGLVRCDCRGIQTDRLCANISEPGCAADKSAALEIGIALTIHEDGHPFAHTVQVIPPAVILGMGCRRNKEAAAVLQAASDCIERLTICREAVAGIASIDLKKEEPGLQRLSEAWQIPFRTYTGGELSAADGDFTPSTFVKKITGIDNVCERSAVLGSGQGTLIQRKTGADGVTTAVAVKKWRGYFE